MESICGINCEECAYLSDGKCAGCIKTHGCPFGKECFIAKFTKIGGKKSFKAFKKQLLDEFNELNVPGMSKIEDLFPLNGELVNLEYPLSNGSTVKFLNDDEIYLGTQVECEYNDGTEKRCYGLVANMDFLIVSEYGENGINPELVIYKKR